MNQPRLYRALKGAGLVLLFVVLLLLPSLVRLAYYYRGAYALIKVPRPDYSAVRLPTLAVAPVEEAHSQSAPQVGEIDPPARGWVIVDRAHQNVVDDAELNVLGSHLTARGLQIRSNAGAENGAQSNPAWPGMLRGALSLMIISPHLPYDGAELAAVERFVEQGGRVVLLGDPSRFALRPLDGTDPLADVLGDVLAPESDVAALNSLASTFGLTFADDYLYNTAENAGNYQYVILRDFGPGPLTAGLSEVVFYAAHSIAVDGETLIAADERTASSLSERRGGLATMSLGGEGRVLAVADYTFMTEPYNTTADNSRLIANIADYVAGAERTFGLSDFPYFFGDQTDLVYLADPAGEAALPAEVIVQAARLQSAFEAVDKTLLWYSGKNGAPVGGLTAEGNTLYVGLYAGLESWSEASEILADRGITLTLETSEQAMARRLEGLNARRQSQDAEPSDPQEQATPTPAPLRDWIYVGGGASAAGMGPVDARQASLFYQNEEGEGQKLIALTFSQENLADIVDRLLAGNYADCLFDEDRGGDPRHIGLAVCPAAYQPPGGGPETAAPDGRGLFAGGAKGTPSEGVDREILIVSDDDGEGVYEEWTSAYDFADIATQAGYRITLWSTTVEGELDLAKMSSFDAVVWCTGDYKEAGSTPDAKELSTLLDYLDGGGRLILSGAFIGPEDGERGLVLDIQVAQAGHPVAEGFEAGQVIPLERFTADEDYAMTVLSETDPQAIVFSRGPDSELSGRAAVVVEEDATTGSKTVRMGVPLYLLPAEERFQLAVNAIGWVLE